MLADVICYLKMTLFMPLDIVTPFLHFKYVTYTYKRMRCLSIGWAGPRSAVGNVSGYRCVSDCRSRGREFDPGPVPYFRGD